MLSAWTVCNFGNRGRTDVVLRQTTLSPTPPPLRPGPSQLLFIFLLYESYGERPSQKAVDGGGGCRGGE